MSAPRLPSSPACGGLPPWRIGDLPQPPALTLRNLFRVIGPGAILLATSIGGGEWLVAPAVGVQYGVRLLWLTTVAVCLQVVFNLEAIRYTLYTGEPIYTGFMRLGPGPRFWATVYTVLSIVQLAWPGLAVFSAGTLFAFASGRLPGTAAGDETVMRVVGSLLILVTAGLLLFGGTIERILEKLSWFMLAYIFGFLVIVNLFFIPMHHTLRTLGGFFSFGAWPGNVEWTLLSALVATAGSGGVGNLTITNWIRDKGFGMGGKVGAIDSAVGSRKTRLSHTGEVFEVNPENLKRWKTWWTYVVADQVWLWGLFCLIGLFLTVNLATHVVPAGSDMQGLAAGTYQAESMARLFWHGFWYLTLLNGFWILYSTHLGNTDLLVRTVTDVLWVGSPWLRERSGRVGTIYYATLAVFSVWALFAVHLASPFALFKLLANVAGFMMVLGGIQIAIVNRRFLPRELQPSLLRQALLWACVAFYGFFFVCASLDVWLR